MRKIDTIVIHHSASPRSTTVSQIREWHKSRGWKDIGYHYVIDRSNKVLAGRPIDKVGAHAKGHNRGSVGICITGDNTHPDEMWREAQIACAKELIASLKIVFPAISAVVGHNEVGRTECPGVNVSITFGVG